MLLLSNHIRYNTILGKFPDKVLGGLLYRQINIFAKYYRRNQTQAQLEWIYLHKFIINE